MLAFSRPLLDWAVRTRLTDPPDGEHKPVDVLEGHRVTGLIPRGGDVAGVILGGDGELHADLVIDATGRGSRAPEWLAALGHPAPPETRVDPLPGFDPGWKALYLQADPPATRRTGGLFPQEGGRWICSLSGAGRDYGPAEETAFLKFAQELRSPVLYDAIRDAEPLTPITVFRRTANHRRHYERLASWPRGFLVTGDAACAFNPIYGQGISVAAVTALVLDRCLRESRPGFERRFQRGAARSAAGAWLVATGEDLRYRETEAAPVRLRTRLINAYVDEVVATANVDRRVCERLVHVLALMTAPTSLFAPNVLARVAAHRVRRPAPVTMPTGPS
jgi:2-polyprenyl-6-methoxyphenol hydroxylase-like FAD-dependent oxidoreductase